MSNQQIIGKNTAVIIIDVQNDFCAPGGTMDRLGRNLSAVESTIPRIDELITFSRSHNILPIFVGSKNSYATDSPAWVNRPDNIKLGPEKGTCRTEWGRDFYKVTPLESEPVVTKHRYSAFLSTNLDQILRAKSIDTIVLCGFYTHICVEGAARDGYMMDYNVITLSDCVAAFEEEQHRFSLQNIKQNFGTVMELGEFIKEVEQ